MFCNFLSPPAAFLVSSFPFPVKTIQFFFFYFPFFNFVFFSFFFRFILIYLGSLPNAILLYYYLYCFLVGDVRLPFLLVSSFKHCYFHKTGTHLYRFSIFLFMFWFFFFVFFSLYIYILYCIYSIFYIFYIYKLLKLHAALVYNSIIWIGPNLKEFDAMNILDVFFFLF